jgi:hypothetical protein
MIGSEENPVIRPNLSATSRAGLEMGSKALGFLGRQRSEHPADGIAAVLARELAHGGASMFCCSSPGSACRAAAIPATRASGCLLLTLVSVGCATRIL